MAVDLFSPKAAADLGGPDWLRARRSAASAVLSGAELPTTALEEWRYSRIGALRPERFAPVAPAAVRPDQVPVRPAALVAELGELAGVVVVHDGVVVDVELSEEVARRGVTFGPAGDADEDALGAATGAPPDVFATMNDALAAAPVVLRVPPGVTVAEPFVVADHTDADGGATFPRLVVLAGDDSEVSVVQVSTSSDVEALVVPLTEVVVGAAARVRMSSLQDLGPRVWQVASLVATVERDATLRASSAALGGEYARLRTDCRLVGRGAHGDLSSVYFGDGDQMLDLRTFQEHRAPDTSSNLLFKGAVADRSHSVYTGLIRIRPEARGTNAFQTNRNLKLSEDAWAESVPNLEIENNDVHCSHASTVGPIDEEQRFYLESRGVPTPVAERLVVGGFFDEVLDELPVPRLAPAIRARLDALLDRQMSAALPATAGGPS